MRANVILLSYNRPNMLKQAMNSLLNQTHDDVVIWLYDDASDFDIDQFVKDEWPDQPGIVVCRAEDVTLEERVAAGSTRWPDNMNWVVDQIPDGEFLTYLCDDDILHPEWLAVVDRALGESPSSHLILSPMFYFQDGEDPFVSGIQGFPAEIGKASKFIMWWHLGAFAYKSECPRTCGVRWGDGIGGYAHSWDVSLCENLKRTHPGYIYLHNPSVYRREHPNTLSARLGRINEDGYYYKPGEELLPEHVAGYLE